MLNYLWNTKSSSGIVLQRYFVPYACLLVKKLVLKAVYRNNIIKRTVSQRHGQRSGGEVGRVQ